MNLIAGLYIVGLLVFGSINTLSTKLTFQMESKNLLGEMEPFQKPWFGSYRMFQGMAVVILLHLGNELRNFLARRSRKNADNYVKLEEECALDEVPQPAALKGYLYTVVPSALDLLGTTCTYVGLFYNSPSVFQMFRGAMIIFATFFSVVVLKRKLTKLKWMGVGMCVFAITIVGVANIMSNKTDKADVDISLKIFGMAMILLGMFIQGGQIVAEELLMKGVEVPPLMIVGMEGVWGVILMLVVIFPIVGSIPGDDIGGVQENLSNDIVMLRNSRALQQVVLVYLFSVFTYNIAGMMVTYSLSAVHRTMIEASRTVVIWAVDLILHYAVNPKYGEVWSSWSFLQLCGFALLILGQMTYSEILTWGLRVPPPKVEAQMSPVWEPGFSPFSPVVSGQGSPVIGPTISPTGRLDLPVELPDEQFELPDAEPLQMTGLDESK